MTANRKSTEAATVRPGYLRRAQAARYLSISVRTLADLQAKRLVPFTKLGARTCLFKISDLDATCARWRVDAVGGEG